MDIAQQRVWAGNLNVKDVGRPVRVGNLNAGGGALPLERNSNSHEHARRESGGPGRGTGFTVYRYRVFRFVRSARRGDRCAIL